MALHLPQWSTRSPQRASTKAPATVDADIFG